LHELARIQLPQKGAKGAKKKLPQKSARNAKAEMLKD